MALTAQSITAEITGIASRLDTPRLADRLGRVVDLVRIEAGHCSAETIAVFDEVLKGLSDIAPLPARAVMARRVSELVDGPSGIVVKLAWDEAIEVAEPVIRRSPLLADSELLGLAQKRGNPHLLAISRRSALAPEVVEVLVQRGDEAVVAAVARRVGAAMSDAAIAVLRDRFSANRGERRTSMRIPVRYPAYLRKAPGSERVPCTVLNISLSGARLALARPTRLPERIYLTMSERAGIERLSEVVWQVDGEVGLRFLASSRRHGA
jgi:Uncharacterised protein conserved in bacteria (DUF2336)/PilZ domain